MTRKCWQTCWELRNYASLWNYWLSALTQTLTEQRHGLFTGALHFSTKMYPKNIVQSCRINVREREVRHWWHGPKKNAKPPTTLPEKKNIPLKHLFLQGKLGVRRGWNGSMGEGKVRGTKSKRKKKINHNTSNIRPLHQLQFSYYINNGRKKEKRLNRRKSRKFLIASNSLLK